LSDPIAKYLQRFASKNREPHHWPEPNETLRLSVVIPAMCERHFLPTVLRSLGKGLLQPERVEVIVVVNEPCDAPPRVSENNQQTLAWLQSARWPFRVLVLDRATGDAAFPAVASGVGEARKLGMDAALARLSRANGQERTLIACLDADSPVSEGYVEALLESGSTHPWVAAVCRYRHPVPGDRGRAAAIVRYEAWCRYMEYGLSVAGSPYAYPTLGSCIVVTALGYAMVRGMSRRQAGEDFYMLQKLAKVSHFPLGRLDTVTVYPSARASTRVPFGTGPAIVDCLQNQGDRYGLVAPPEAFFELRHLFTSLGELFDEERCLKDLAPSLRTFLDVRKAGEVLPRLRQHARDRAGFVRAFHGWFDALATIQYAKSKGAMHIADAVGVLAADQGLDRSALDESPQALLDWLRNATDSVK
jgi:hypothetical protein